MAVLAARRRLAALACAAAAALAPPACRGPADPAAETVRSLVRDANHRDAGKIAAALASGFQGSGGMGRNDLDAELRRLFAAYASVDVSVSGLAIERFPDFDLARFEASFHGSARKIGGLEALLPSSARYRFEIRLARDGERRLVTQAVWEEIPE
ncbi:MAG TPA: hypothetical protein VKH46_03455 [Thermoanaerobaculia bacterium]|jgi:hypothetical protein|nr:hypothetical protein [Thermoanaerobaculia bacterium]